MRGQGCARISSQLVGGWIQKRVNGLVGGRLCGKAANSPVPATPNISTTSERRVFRRQFQRRRRRTQVIDPQRARRP